MHSSSKNPWQEAEAYGIDTSLLQSNLELSYEERMDQHESALDFLLEILQAKEQIYGKPQKDNPDIVREPD